jgi:putative phosphoesterase
LGNTDLKTLRILNGKKLKKPTKEEKRVMYFWTSENLRAENIAYLKSLPKKTDFSVGRFRIGVFHGTLEDPDEELFPSAPESRFQQLAKDAPYQVQIMGHSHVPYYKIVNGVHFINPGSVGRMFDGDPRTSFAILKVYADEIAVEHFRIAYAVEDVVNDLKEKKLPSIYTKMFRVGKKLN